jgi:hypothetical protein
MDAFDRFWRWAEKPLKDPLTVPAGIHHEVMSLPPAERRDRAKVNKAVRKAKETDNENPAQHRP